LHWKITVYSQTYPHALKIERVSISPTHLDYWLPKQHTRRPKGKGRERFAQAALLSTEPEGTGTRLAGQEKFNRVREILAA